MRKTSNYNAPKKRGKSPYYYHNFSVEGKRIRTSTGTTSKREADEISLEYFNELLGIVNEAADNAITIEDAIFRYISEYAVELVSYKDVRRMALRFLDFLNNRYWWHTIENSDLAKYVLTRRRENVPKSERFISAKTINYELSILSRINNLVENSWGSKRANFNTAIHRVKTEKKAPTYLTEEQERELYKYMPEHFAKAFRFLILTGLRTKHVFTSNNKNDYIRKKDIDANWVLVVSTKSRQPGGKVHHVPLINEAIEIIEWFGLDDIGPDDAVFRYPDTIRAKDRIGKPLRSYNNILNKALNKAGIETPRGTLMHITRHTSATRIAQRTKDVVAVRDILGHSNISTSNIYMHSNKDKLRDYLEDSFKKDGQI